MVQLGKLAATLASSVGAKAGDVPSDYCLPLPSPNFPGPSSSVFSSLLMMLCVSCLCIPVHSQPGIISFAQERIVVNEGSALLTPVTIPLQRMGNTAGTVVISITVCVVWGVVCYTVSCHGH